jgi:uncharacterized membrane protein
MAIAITMLILKIAVPYVESGESLGAALADQWPSYAAYVVSFLTIGSEPRRGALQWEEPVTQ